MSGLKEGQPSGCWVRGETVPRGSGSCTRDSRRKGFDLYPKARGSHGVVSSAGSGITRCEFLLHILFLIFKTIHLCGCLTHHLWPGWRQVPAGAQTVRTALTASDAAGVSQRRDSRLLSGRPSWEKPVPGAVCRWSKDRTRAEPCCRRGPLKESLRSLPQFRLC